MYLVTKLPSFKVTKLPIYKVTKLPTYQVSKLPRYQSYKATKFKKNTKFPSLQVLKFQSFKVTKLPIYQITKLPSYKVTKFLNYGAGGQKKIFKKSSQGGDIFIGSLIFSESAHWADSVIESPCQSVCRFVCLWKFKTPSSGVRGDFWSNAYRKCWAAMTQFFLLLSVWMIFFVLAIFNFFGFL